MRACVWFKRGIHILNQNENYTFIIQIANTILNKCISIYLYKIGNITKAIIGLNVRSIIMHNRGITHIVKTDSSFC